MHIVQLSQGKRYSNDYEECSLSNSSLNYCTHNFTTKNDILPPYKVDPPWNVTILATHMDPFHSVLQQEVG